jgi:hypothetical protein
VRPADVDIALIEVDDHVTGYRVRELPIGIEHLLLHL